MSNGGDPLAVLGPPPQEQQAPTGGPLAVLGESTDPLSVLGAPPIVPLRTRFPVETAMEDERLGVGGIIKAVPGFLFSVAKEIGIDLKNAMLLSLGGFDALGRELSEQVSRVPGPVGGAARLASGISRSIEEALGAQEQTDPTMPIRTRDFTETRADFLSRRASEGDVQAKEIMDSSVRGTALMASFLPAMWFSRAFPRGSAGIRVMGRAGAFMIGEGLAGATFGGIRPLHEDESRLAAVGLDAALFTMFGVGLRSLGVGYTRYVKALPRARRIAVLRRMSEIAEEQAGAIRASGENPALLHPLEKQAVQVRSLREAVQQLEPNPVDIESKILAAAHRQIEVTPRFDDVINLEGLIGPAPREVKFPDAFIIEKTPEFVSPPRIEPVPAPRGLVRAADVLTKDLQEIERRVVVREAEAAVRGGVPEQIAASEVARAAEGEAQLAAVQKAAGIVEPPVVTEGLVEGMRRAGIERFRRIRADIDRVRTGETGAPAVEAAIAASEALSVPQREHLRRILKQATQQAAIVTGRARLITPATRAVDDVIESALEPRAVTLPMPAPRGLQPTITGERVTGAPGSIEELALARDAIDDAVARLDPVAVMSQSTQREVLAFRQLAKDPATLKTRPSQRVADAIDRALDKETPLAEQGLAMELFGSGPREIDLAARLPRAERDKVRRVLNRALKREKGEAGGDLELSPYETINATWIEDVAAPQGLTGPKLTAWQMAAHMTDEQLGRWAKLMDERGAASQAVLARLSLAGVGGFFEVAARADELPIIGTVGPGERKAMHTVGRFLMFAAGASTFAGWMRNRQVVRRVLLAHNPTLAFTGSTKEAFQLYWEMMTSGKGTAKTQERMLRSIFADERSRRSAMFVLDEGAIAPEYAFLSAKQQVEAAEMHQYNLWLGRRLQDLGVIERHREDYVRHLLPPETFARWRQNPQAALPTGGAFTRRRRFASLRELEAWAQRENLAGPIMDPSVVQALHIREAHRAIGNVMLRKDLERLGLVWKPVEGEVVPVGMREVKGMRGKVAPDEVATAIENISAPRASEQEWINGLDTIKGWWMRSIMLWIWEHGLNALRSVPGLTLNPVAGARGLSRAHKAVMNADPVFIEGIRHGGNPFGRPDFGARTAKTFEGVMSKLGEHAPTIVRLQKAGAHLVHLQDRGLWDHTIPTIWMFAYSTEMKRWSDVAVRKLVKGSNKYLPGSPEYRDAARRAAQFANNVVGKLPTEMQNPAVARAMRLTLFSPQWSLTRISLTAHAGGELGDVVAGKLPMHDAMYLRFKTRQLLALVGVTWAGSRLISGKDPEFNPNTNKFYMQTGLKTDTGRKLGVDLAGWWQDDIKFFNVPDQFLLARLNPSFRVVGETIEGRDFTGRRMTGMQRVENLIRSFGPPGETLELLARLQAGGMRPAEAVQRISNVLATGNVSSLPRPLDVAISRYAKRLLQRVGIPANDSNVFDLSRLIRSNYLMGRDLLDDNVMRFVAYRRRSTKIRQPLDWFFHETKEAIGDLIQESREP